jgi:serine/threonine protein kinase
VFEVSTNGTLFELCQKRGKLSLEVTRAYAAQMADLIDFMHGQMLSHRDMKPHNLMLDDDFNLKLVSISNH